MSRPSGKTEAFSRVVIDAQLADVGWNLKDGQSVRYEYPLPDGTRADYVLCDRHGRAMAVVEAKRAAVNLQEAVAQGRAYAEQLDGVPYAFWLTARIFCSGATRTKLTRCLSVPSSRGRLGKAYHQV